MDFLFSCTEPCSFKAATSSQYNQIEGQVSCLSSLISCLISVFSDQHNVQSYYNMIRNKIINKNAAGGTVGRIPSGKEMLLGKSAERKNSSSVRDQKSPQLYNNSS